MRYFNKQAQIKSSVLSKDKFVLELKREYALSCRTGKPFELILFSFSNENCNTAVFLEVLHSRVRTTDIIGWLDKDKLGIILYDADISVSDKFIDSLHEKIRYIGSAFPKHETYIYPNSDMLDS